MTTIVTKDHDIGYCTAIQPVCLDTSSVLPFFAIPMQYGDAGPPDTTLVFLSILPSMLRMLQRGIKFPVCVYNLLPVTSFAPCSCIAPSIDSPKG